VLAPERGPLVNGAIRNVRIRITDVAISDDVSALVVFPDFLPPMYPAIAGPAMGIHHSISEKRTE
jgi:hypothetical protein